MGLFHWLGGFAGGSVQDVLMQVRENKPIDDIVTFREAGHLYVEIYYTDGTACYADQYMKLGEMQLDVSYE